MKTVVQGTKSIQHFKNKIFRGEFQVTWIMGSLADLVTKRTRYHHKRVKLECLNHFYYFLWLHFSKLSGLFSLTNVLVTN